MESRKTQVLRMTHTIFNIATGSLVRVTGKDNEQHLFVCQCLSGNYDLYDLQDKNISWGLSCDTLNEMREALLMDFLQGEIKNIKA